MKDNSVNLLVLHPELKLAMNRIIFVAIASLIIASSCQWKTKDNTITIVALKGPSAMGMIKMIDSISNATNTNIRIEIVNEPIQARKMMLDGSAQFAVIPTTLGSILYNKGLDYRALAIPVWGTLYLFGTDRTITQWEHLKGKRVYSMAKGMSPDELFRHLLLENGLIPDKDVELDYSFPTHIDLANAVAAGKAPLGVISEPLVSMVELRNEQVFSIFDLNDEWKKIHNEPFAQTALMVSHEFATSHPKEVEQIVKSYKFSTQWVNDEPNSAAKLIVKYNILPDEEVALRAIPKAQLKFELARDVKDGVIDYLRVFYAMNPDIIGGKIPDENFIY